MRQALDDCPKTVRIKAITAGWRKEALTMMSLILLVVALAMIGALIGRKKLSYGFFALS